MHINIIIISEYMVGQVPSDRRGGRRDTTGTFKHLGGQVPCDREWTITR